MGIKKSKPAKRETGRLGARDFLYAANCGDAGSCGFVIPQPMGGLGFHFPGGLGRSRRRNRPQDGPGCLAGRDGDDEVPLDTPLQTRGTRETSMEAVRRSYKCVETLTRLAERELMMLIFGHFGSFGGRENAFGVVPPPHHLVDHGTQYPGCIYEL